MIWKELCLFIFGWCTDQTYFKELTDNDIRQQMYKENQDQMEQIWALLVLLLMV